MPPFVHQSVSAATYAGKYLPVRIRGETYGIRCDRVRGQAGMNEILARADLASFVSGFITRRGRLIPVLDLHQALVGGSVPPMGVTILVVQSSSDNHPGLPVGLCVDHVAEPVLITADDISGWTPCLHGDEGLPCLAKVRGRIGALLDIDAIVEQAIFRGGTATR